MPVYVLILLLLCSCNSLFYYPDNVLYKEADPKNPFEEYAVKSQDETLHAVRFIHKTQKCLGLITQFHGNAQNLTAHAELVRWLTGSGYDVLTFDYRGYGISTGKPTREGLVEDGRAVLRFSESLAPECPRRIVIGQSLGGTIAVPAIALSQTKLGAVVLDSTFPSYRGITQEKLSDNWFTWPFQWPLSLLVSDDYSLIDYLPKIKQPLVVIHGTKDRIIPFELGKKIFEESSSECKFFWEEKSLGHIQAMTKKSIQEKLVRFLKNLEKECPTRSARSNGHMTETIDSPSVPRSSQSVIQSPEKGL